MHTLGWTFEAHYQPFHWVSTFHSQHLQTQYIGLCESAGSSTVHPATQSFFKGEHNHHEMEWEHLNRNIISCYIIYVYEDMGYALVHV